MPWSSITQTGADIHYAMGGGQAIGIRFNACISYQPIKLKVGQRRDNAKFTSDF